MSKVNSHSCKNPLCNEHTVRKEKSSATICMCRAQFSTERGISSRAVEFALFHGILIYLQNFTEVEKQPATGMIVGLMTQFYHVM